MTDNLSFRIAQETDIPKLSFLVNSAYRGESSKQGWTYEADLLDGQRIDADMLRAIIQSEQEIIMLSFLNADKLIGCVQLKNAGHYAYIGMLTIDPTLQANGFGKQLLAAAEQWVQANWHAEYAEMTVINTRTELIAWYEKRGYILTPEKRPFPYGDERFGKPKLQGLEFIVLRKPFVAINCTVTLPA